VSALSDTVRRIRTMRGVVPLIRSFAASLTRLRHYDVLSFCSSSSSSSSNTISANRNGRKLQDGPTDAVAADNNDDDVGFGFPQPEFDNTRLIFASKSTAEMVRAYLVFGACSFDVLVNNQTKVVVFSAQLLFTCR